MLSAPALLGEAHDLQLFDSGHDSLDEWLRRRARANQVSGASRTYVVCEGERVVGYYVPVVGSARSRGRAGSYPAQHARPRSHGGAWPSGHRPQLAGKGIGPALLQDAVLRTGQAAHIMGIRGLLVHAISDEAKAFYEYHGFTASPANPMTLVLSLKAR